LDHKLLPDRHLFLTLTAVPLYLWYFGIDWFYFAVAAVLLALTGFSITLGYHRLFAHATFRARLPVRLFVLIFGAAAFENSVLMWTSEHRRHHKHVQGAPKEIEMREKKEVGVRE